MLELTPCMRAQLLAWYEEELAGNDGPKRCRQRGRTASALVEWGLAERVTGRYYYEMFELTDDGRAVARSHHKAGA